MNVESTTGLGSSAGLGRDEIYRVCEAGYNEVANKIVHHPAMSELEKFGGIIFSRPLSRPEMALFFATIWAFFKDVPAGIVALAARVTDEWIKEDMWNGTAKAAHILYASVDEYGLHQHSKHMLPTHHQMFKQLTTHLGLSDTELFNPQYILPEGTAMGNNTHRMYRSEYLGEALGFHLASEMTSSREFQIFLKGFQKYAEEYGLVDEDDPVLAFFAIHCEVEPMHVATGRQIMISYLEKHPNIAPQAMRGALAFMDGFEQMFAALNRRLA
ncbi:iron-containing redox enzyme family protein [Pseudomonas rhodesiae]|uniref:iron-containing redox enzyme family protein n=1 Tax=Pseudomonas rhodesiae TaxID=76760 RepID=UPI0028A942FD|nr:iron-containing redox enzyme family protein [Pseudomonas rhodesiae]